MSERKNPSTSIEAYKALTPEKLRTDYGKIIEALKVLGSATYEQISDYIQCREPNVVSRRLSELERMQIIWKPGLKKLTKRNRNAFVYQLTDVSQPKTEAEEKMYADIRKIVTEAEIKLIEAVKEQKRTQATLFY